MLFLYLFYSFIYDVEVEVFENKMLIHVPKMYY